LGCAARLDGWPLCPRWVLPPLSNISLRNKGEREKGVQGEKPIGGSEPAIWLVGVLERPFLEIVRAEEPAGAGKTNKGGNGVGMATGEEGAPQSRWHP